MVAVITLGGVASAKERDMGRLLHAIDDCFAGTENVCHQTCQLEARLIRLSRKLHDNATAQLEVERFWDATRHDLRLALRKATHEFVQRMKAAATQ